MKTVRFASAASFSNPTDAGGESILRTPAGLADKPRRRQAFRPVIRALVDNSARVSVSKLFPNLKAGRLRMQDPHLHCMARFGLFVAALVATGLNVAAETLDDVRQAAAAVARVRAETATLESDWRWQRETLGASWQALIQQKDALAHDAELWKANLSAENSEIAGLQAKSGAARAIFDEVDQRLKAISEQLVSMQPWLPPRLARAVELPCRTLGDPRLPAAERMQHIATVWSRCMLFNRSITCAEEALTLGGDKNARVIEVIYWGLSHGYALDTSNGTAFHGFPGKDGWVWEEQPDIAPRVARLVAIYNDRADPELVSVPAQVTNPFAGSAK